MSQKFLAALKERWLSFRNKGWRSGLVLVAVMAVLLALGCCLLSLLPWSELDAFLGRPYSTRLYDRNGQLLQVLPLEDGLRREWYDLDQLPPRVVDVFLAAEDQGFYHHCGVDVVAVVRAAFQNMSQGRRVSGASTVTMQLARLVEPRGGGGVSLWTKLVEALAAVRLELRLSKEEILELYLNNLPFGSQAEGIGSAARTYFGCTPQQLSDSQIHALAVIPRRPATYNPSNPDASFQAALQIGRVTGFDSTLEQWRDSLHQQEPYRYPHRLPHFCRYVQNLHSGGGIPPELHLSVDAVLTEQVENLVSTRLTEFQQFRLKHGAVLAMDNVTGEIICWSGGDFWNQETGQVDGVLVRNQSGSTMKPFIYAMALEAGIAPTTVLADIPMDFGQGEAYVPLNFNNRFNGPVLFRTALASSLNIPAVYLLHQLGEEKYLSVMERLGVESLAGLQDYGLSLALGSGELTLLELVRAFSVFPRGGRSAHTTHLRDGLEGANALLEGAQVFQPDTAAIICDMLSDRRARALGFGFTQVFSTEYPAIFKTGTSNQFQNIVALGATSRYTVGVWMGNYSGETVVSQTGSGVPATVARYLLDELSAANPSFIEDFPEPKQFQKVPVCSLSGMGVTGFCPSVTEEYVSVAVTAQTGLDGGRLDGRGLERCSWHYSAEDLFSGRGTRAFTVTSVRYPQEYQRWLQGQVTPSQFFPTARLHILYPQPGAVFLYDTLIPLSAQKIRVDATGSGSQAELFVNGTSAGVSAPPFSWFVPLELGTMQLEVVLEDGQQVTQEVYVR